MAEFIPLGTIGDLEAAFFYDIKLCGIYTILDIYLGDFSHILIVFKRFTDPKFHYVLQVYRETIK